MARLFDQMKELVERQRLGFVATICPDGTQPCYDRPTDEASVRAHWLQHYVGEMGKESV